MDINVSTTLDFDFLSRKLRAKLGTVYGKLSYNVPVPLCQPMAVSLDDGEIAGEERMGGEGRGVGK